MNEKKLNFPGIHDRINAGWTRVKVFFLIFAFLTLISCTEQTQNFIADENTLKNLAISLDEGTDWTKKIVHGDKLRKPVSNVERSEESVVFMPELHSGKVWPVMNGFTSLDISYLENNRILMDSLDSFCSAFILDRTVSGLRSFFHPSHVYSLRVFLLDVEDRFSDARFDAYIFGKPFASEDFVSCPVLFSSDEGNPIFAVKVNFAKKDGLWKISSVVFMHKDESNEEQ